VVVGMVVVVVEMVVVVAVEMEVFVVFDTKDDEDKDSSVVDGAVVTVVIS